MLLKILCQLNQEIHESSSELTTISRGALQVALFTVLWFNWSVQNHCAAEVLKTFWEILLHENDCNYNSYIFSSKFAFIPFCVCLWSITLCNCLTVYFLPLLRLSWNMEQFGGKIYFTDHRTANSCCYTRKFFWSIFFWTSRSKGEFPKD